MEDMNVIIHKILKKVSENRHISLHRMKIIYKILENTEIYTTNSVPDVIYHKSKDGFLKVKYSVESFSPQVIDFKPMLHNRNTAFFYPVMIIPESEKSENQWRWKVVHEICHLLSIGEYEIHNKKIYHKFGLNNYQYEISSNEVICTKKVVYYRENEILNDAVTWYFLERTYEDLISPPDDYIDFHCRPIKTRNDIDTLIGCYFSGKYGAETELLKIFDKKI